MQQTGISITTPALHVTNLVWGNATSDKKASQNADHFQIFFICSTGKTGKKIQQQKLAV
jgi:hypothetical protein